MKHKHYDMICAKAANMDLVVFVKTCGNGAWYEKDNQACQWWEDSNYFLCLPKHKEAVLNLLNGGESQVKYDNWSYCNLDAGNRWSNGWWYMDEKCESRIKPRKEKRWIAYSSDSKRLGVLSFDSLHEISEYYSNEEEILQFIEIEVEA